MAEGGGGGGGGRELLNYLHADVEFRTYVLMLVINIAIYSFTSVFQCNHARSCSCDLRYHHSITKLLTLANLPTKLSV